MSDSIKCSDVLEPEYQLKVPLRACRTACRGAVRRFYRVRLFKDVQEKWNIHEMFVE